SKRRSTCIEPAASTPAIVARFLQALRYDRCVDFPGEVLVDVRVGRHGDSFLHSRLVLLSRALVNSSISSTHQEVFPTLPNSDLAPLSRPDKRRAMTPSQRSGPMMRQIRSREQSAGSSARA